MSIRIEVDPELCGMGQGSECCAYLCCDLEGFCCGREISSFKYTIDCRIKLGTIGAKRIPLREFPYCQLTTVGIQDDAL